MLFNELRLGPEVGHASLEPAKMSVENMEGISVIFGPNATWRANHVGPSVLMCLASNGYSPAQFIAKS